MYDLSIYCVISEQNCPDMKRHCTIILDHVVMNVPIKKEKHEISKGWCPFRLLYLKRRNKETL